MFDLIAPDSDPLDFELPALGSPASSSSGAAASASEEAAPSSPLGSDLQVFGSYLVDSNSSTPYTDATQVNIMTGPRNSLAYSAGMAL